MAFNRSSITSERPALMQPKEQFLSANDMYGHRQTGRKLLSERSKSSIGSILGSANESAENQRSPADKYKNNRRFASNRKPFASTFNIYKPDEAVMPTTKQAKAYRKQRETCPFGTDENAQDLQTPRTLARSQCPFGTESDEIVDMSQDMVQLRKEHGVKVNALYGGKGSGDVMGRRHKGTGIIHQDGAGKLTIRESFPGFERWNQ
eukprot:g2982.t1